MRMSGVADLATDRSAITWNIEHYRRLLSDETNDLARMIIADLLSTEVDRLADLDEPKPPSRGRDDRSIS